MAHYRVTLELIVGDTDTPQEALDTVLSGHDLSQMLNVEEINPDAQQGTLYDELQSMARQLRWALQHKADGNQYEATVLTETVRERLLALADAEAFHHYDKPEHREPAEGAAYRINPKTGEATPLRPNDDKEE